LKVKSKKWQTAQRVSHSDESDNFVLARSVLAYREAAKRVGGNVLEIGTGSGYGMQTLAPVARTLITVDKREPGGLEVPEGVEFRRMKVPPVDMPSAAFDFVVSFQVIEHIKDDFAFLDEVKRVLKPGGKFIVTTPNAPASLTRNPWHVREYTAGQFSSLMGSRFGKVEARGVFGDERVMDYYRRNRESVRRITRFDPLDLQHRLPGWMLRLPYDVANRLSRRRLLSENRELTRSITPGDYRLGPVSDRAFDLFYIGTKQ
jgi:2-polyprenyl-3-methyl-5-hydroxy-6-metoxy-1,4-benzoquinol methylase